ncbi:MAG TPA: outer membrane protein transport protein [Nitrospiraceae bacterium]|nr:outer membrane protein transport protein [Nitrospiraceae bacterium]
MVRVVRARWRSLSAQALTIPVLSLSLCWSSGPACAQVPRIQGQGTAASGMGNAFAAQADDPSALHYNPAGMTQLHGMQVMLGGLLSGGTTDFTNSSGVHATGDRDGSLAWPPPTHAFLVANVKELGLTALGDLAAGIGVTVPFGSIMRWPDNVPFRAVTVFSTLPLIDIKPTLAYQLTRDLSVGVGADIYTFSGMFGEGHAESQSISPGGPLTPLFGQAGSKVELYGKDTATGFNAGLLYTAIRNGEGQPIANLAFVYRSEATLHLAGALTSNGNKVQDAMTTLVLPQVITGGIALWPVRNREREWKLEIDVDYVGWKSVGNLDIRLANGTVIPQPQNWKGTYATMVGSEYRWSKVDSMPEWEWAVRGGYTFQPSQMPALTFNPGIPSADVHVLSTGAGLLCKENGSLLGIVNWGSLGLGLVHVKGIGLDLSYQTSLYEPRTVSGNTGIRTGVNGLYKSTFYTGGLSLRLMF